MKYILSTAILIFSLGFTAFAQTNLCQEIKIKAPQSIYKDGVFKVAASFKENNQNIDSPVRWKIIKGNEIVGRIDKGVTELDAKGVEQGSLILVIAETDDKCRSLAMATVLVEIPCALPYTIDEYRKLSWNDERARLDNVAFYWQRSNQSKDMQNNKLFVFLEFSKDASKNAIKNRIEKILSYLSTTHTIKKEKLLFLISESDMEQVKYQVLPASFADFYDPTTLVIKGEDFEKLQILFQLKTLSRKK